MSEPNATQDHMALSSWELDTLGRYNAEVARGLLHTDEWKKKMEELQARFDRRYR